MRFRLTVDGEAHEIEVDRGSEDVRIRVDGAEYRARTRASDDGFAVRIGPKVHRIRFQGVDVLVDGARYPVGISGIQEDRASRAQDSAATGRRDLQVRAPMPGRVARVFVQPGDRVKRGQTLVILEAMKMQNEIPSPQDGRVRAVEVVEGESITADRVVAVIETH
jgi:biotin carboxyl carrier protein